MLGKQIRGLGHLSRCCNDNPIRIFMLLEGNQYPIEGIAICDGESLYILNNEFRNIDRVDKKPIVDIMMKNDYNYVLRFPRKEPYRRYDYARLIKQIIAVPDNFNEKYGEFLAQNKKVISPIVSKIGDNLLNISWCRYLFIFTENSKNFFAWALNSRLRGANIVAIIEALIWNDNYQQLAKNLKKGTITAYTTAIDIMRLSDEMCALRRSKRVNDTINMFNTKQKKLLRDIANNENIYNVMSKFRRLTPTKQNNFIRKMSTVEDANEIIKQMAFVSDVHFSWSKKDLMEYLENNPHLSYKVVVDNGPVVLVEVKDFDTVKRLAKNTNWCISKNKQYWNNYMSQSHINNGTKQYVLFDFDQKEDDVRSIVGFTLNMKKGITASHDYVNNNILDNRINKTQYFRSKFNTLVPTKASNGGIHALLASKGIDISTLIPRTNSEYLWNQESFFQFLTKCMDGDTTTFDILNSNDNCIAILVEDKRIHKLFGASYVTKVPREMWGNEHIIFADFNANPESPDRIKFAIISYDQRSNEAYPSVIMNGACDQIPISFEELLETYGLPYDIICRSDSLNDRLFSAFTNFDLTNVKNIMNEAKNTKKFNFPDDDKVEITDSIKKTLFVYLSDEYLKAIYGAGNTLEGLIGSNLVNDIIARFIMLISQLSTDDINSSDVERLLKRDRSIPTGKAEYMALCYMLNMIFDNENSTVKKKICSHIINRHTKNKFLLRLYEKHNGKAPAKAVSSKSSSIHMESLF